jgi:hypothetical protein
VSADQKCDCIYSYICTKRSFFISPEQALLDDDDSDDDYNDDDGDDEGGDEGLSVCVDYYNCLFEITRSICFFEIQTYEYLQIYKNYLSMLILQFRETSIYSFKQSKLAGCIKKSKQN